jgi:hypothetical protein
VDGHGGWVSVECEIPQLLQQLEAGEHGSGVRRQEIQEVELLGRQRDRPLLHADLTGPRVDLQAAEDQWVSVVRGPACRTTKDGSDPGHHLSRRERLRDVVVRPDLEADDPIRLLALRREHDHRRVRAFPDPGEDFGSVQPRQHEVEEDQVRRLCFEGLEGSLPVLRRVHGEAVSCQVAAEHLAHDGLVVHDQDASAHGPIVNAAPFRSIATSLPSGRKGPSR